MSNPYDPRPEPGSHPSEGRGQPSEPNPYGQPSEPNPYAQTSQPDPYGQAAPNPYTQPADPNAYGQPAPYGQPPAYGQQPYGQQLPYGQPAYGGTPYGMAPQPHPQGTVILVLGIIGLVACVVPGIVALVMGNKALKEIDANPAAYSNRQNVQVGRILGIISIVVWAAIIVVYVVLFAGVAATSYGH